MIYGGLREDVGTKFVYAWPNGLREKAEAAVSWDLDLLERIMRYISSREEEDVATNMCRCGATIESRTHILVECEIYKEERDALKETRNLDVCDME